MRPEKMTSRLQESIADAQSLAIGRDHTVLEPVHLLAAMLEQKPAAMATLLSNAGADLPGLRGKVEESLERLPSLNSPTGEIAPSAGFIKVFNLADRAAQSAGDSYLASEQVLLVMFSDSTVGSIFSQSGVS